jgi:hypothetical protein
MKGGGGYTCRAGVSFLLPQRLDNLADTLANLKKNVRNWLKDGGDAVDGTALPPLSIRHFVLDFPVKSCRPRTTSPWQHVLEPARDQANGVIEHSRSEIVLPKHGPTEGADSMPE